jgi:hypothetical protein
MQLAFRMGERLPFLSLLAVGWELLALMVDLLAESG